MKVVRRFLFLSSLVMLLWTAVPMVGMSQCPMCKAAVESNNGDSKIAGGLNTGILYLFVLPYTVAMGVGIWWWRHSRRRKRMEAIQKQSAGHDLDQYTS